jgi:hypothetical protein
MRAPVLPAEPTALDRSTLNYLESYPDVWALFCRFAFELIRAGREHGGAKAIVERIRWECATSAHYADLDFVVNNSHTASLVRIFEATYPEQSGFFRTRKRPTESKRAA